MCDTMHTKHVQVKLLLYLCNHSNMNALKHQIIITSKANPSGGHVVVGKTFESGHGIHNHNFDVV